MGDRTPMTDAAVTTALGDRPAWTLVAGRLVRERDCGTWGAAFALLAQIAGHAERLDHHPDWSQRGSTLRLEVVTHRPPGISQLDFDLADAIDVVLAEPPA